MVHGCMRCRLGGKFFWRDSGAASPYLHPGPSRENDTHLPVNVEPWLGPLRIANDPVAL